MFETNSDECLVNPGWKQLNGTDAIDDCEQSFGAEYDAYRKKWYDYPKKYIVSEFPLHIDIETTNACNLKCIMCIWREQEKKIGYMEWDLFTKIIDECAKYNLPSVKFNLRGEPLLDKRIVEMVRYAKKRGIIEVQFNTNGLLLNERLGIQLINAGLDRIVFSVDGATKETYEKIRKGGNYEKLVKNINTFVRMRNDLGKKRPCTRVQMVVLEDTKSQIDQFIEQWKNIVNRIALIRKRSFESKGNPEGFPCPQLWQRLVVQWNGKVKMCCSDWTGESILGDVRRERLYDIWHSDKLKKIRQLHRKRQFGQLIACRKCEVNKVISPI